MKFLWVLMMLTACGCATGSGKVVQMSVVGDVNRPGILGVRASKALTTQEIIGIAGGISSEALGTRPSATLHIQSGGGRSDNLRIYKANFGTPLGELGINAARVWKVEVDGGIL